MDHTSQVDLRGVVDLLATVGRSSQRDELGFARQEFPGRFGIGLLSAFLVADVFSGDRMGVFRCPAGIRWCVTRHDRDVPDEESAAAAAEFAWAIRGPFRGGGAGAP
ncbi:hypothetical protein JOF53_006910 [Crossiella equi]|uniref:Uncharacterized protein n=1 Tax=Crossiella equi TaxID=130796 RepID=A0ABS5AN96_9PSEU|nr:hypothetical protein [Crossiella equi]MBP2478038.1 hypothetical protein [Crossiella equi]